MLVSQPHRFQKISAGGGREKRRNGAQPQNEILRKGVWGLCHQQAKTDFQHDRRKSVLSICGNKDTACHFGKEPLPGLAAHLETER